MRSCDLLWHIRRLSRKPVTDLCPRRNSQCRSQSRVGIAEPEIAAMQRRHRGCQAQSQAGTGLGYAIAIIGAVNTVIAFGYYGNIMREMWMKPAPNGDTAPIKIPPSLLAALAITGTGTFVLGILPGLVLRFGDLRALTGAFGR